MKGSSKLAMILCGKEAILYPVDVAQKVNPNKIAIILCEENMPDVKFPVSIEVVLQKVSSQGTGHSAQYALNKLGWFDNDPEDVLCLLGDCPLIQKEDLLKLIHARNTSPDVDLWVIGFQANHDHTYGRLLVDEQGELISIIEHKEATSEQKKISLCNSGVMLFRKGSGLNCLKNLSSHLTYQKNEGLNHEQEIYITDVFTLAKKQGLKCCVIEVSEPLYGMNTSEDVARVFEHLQKRWRKKLQQSGAVMYAPETVFLCEDTIAYPGAFIHPHVVFGRGVTLSSGSIIESFSHLEDVFIASEARIGPFARIRGQSHIGVQAQVGCFVDLKSSHIGEKTKIKHLAYIGDAHVGKQTNIGAGTVICNYDGQLKHPTHIGSHVFIGANNSLIAPVTLEDGCKTGAHSCITRRVEKGAIAVSRSPQKNFFVLKES